MIELIMHGNKSGSKDDFYQSIVLCNVVSLVFMIVFAGLYGFMNYYVMKRPEFVEKESKPGKIVNEYIVNAKKELKQEKKALKEKEFK